MGYKGNRLVIVAAGCPLMAGAQARMTTPRLSCGC